MPTLTEGRHPGGFLVWGDPSLYDGTLNLLRGIPGLEIVSIAGISSVAALAAAHGVPLFQPGKRLGGGGPEGIGVFDGLLIISVIFFQGAGANGRHF